MAHPPSSTGESAPASHSPGHTGPGQGGGTGLDQGHGGVQGGQTGVISGSLNVWLHGANAQP